MIDYYELWFLLGIVAAWYKYMDLKHYDKVGLELLDYYVLFLWVCGGLVSASIVIYDICVKGWWHK